MENKEWTGWDAAYFEADFGHYVDLYESRTVSPTLNSEPKSDTNTPPHIQ